MGYIFDFKDAGTYDAWFDQKKNRYRLDLGIKLMLDLLEPGMGQRILDIGCGTGISLESLVEKEVSLTGIDPSPYMLDVAAEKFGDTVDLHRGTAEDLPFEDNAFDSAFFYTSLEYTQRPAKAVEEACRVAKDTLVICVLNRYAPMNAGRRIKGFFKPTVYNHAHFFSIWELKRLLHAMLGKVPVKWRTTLQFPFTYGAVAGWVENRMIVQKSCFGTLIGMKIKPVPKFRTRPMVLRLDKPENYKPVTGWTRMRE